jgi:hypothetical protein
MTIAVAVAVPDGIALAADTQTTWQRTITNAKDKATGTEFELAEPILVPIGWSRMARKLFSLTMSGSTYAVATSGAAMLNNRTAFSIFRSLENAYSGDGTHEDVMNYLINGVKEQLRTQLGVTDLAASPRLADLNFILAGYEDHDVARPVLRVISVYSGKRRKPQQPDDPEPSHLIIWQNSPENRFGCCWTGRNEFIDHIVNHKNRALPSITGYYPGMTLADAIDYVRFLAEFTCDFQRFATMVPDCGRPVLSASLTPAGYEDRLTSPQMDLS